MYKDLYITKLRLFFSRSFYLVILFNCAIPVLHAQHDNNWYFASHAGINFNTNPPSALAGGMLDIGEGCSTMSDDNGQLLFYTDGVTVWNKLHQVMLNGTGLKGHSSSSNSAIIIPRPGSSTIYYIFTAGELSTNNEGYFFSEVDISLDGGLGAITGTKNTILYAPGTEKLTAVRHSNGIDVWIITRVFGIAEWKTFKVDCNGVNTIPVTSFSDHPSNSLWKDAVVGSLKASPDGTKIAATNPNQDIWEILQFDATTGTLSNNLYFISGFSPYGVEFSPNSQLIYISDAFLNFPLPTGGISQYNLATYDSVAIRSSKVFIGNTDGFAGALQLGPDKKIYCSVGVNLSYLGAVSNPDLPGIACGFNNHQVDLAPGTFTYFGLPVSFPRVAIDANADFNYTIQANCATVDFIANTSIPGSINWQWDFGDGTGSVLQNPQKLYTIPGIYEVKLVVGFSSGCILDTIKKNVTVAGRPRAGIDVTGGCVNKNISLVDASVITGDIINRWFWSFGDGNISVDQNPVTSYPVNGSYTIKHVVETVSGCVSDTAITVVRIESVPVAGIAEINGCQGQAVQFADSSSNEFGDITTWNWDFGDGGISTLQNGTHSYAAPGAYTVKLSVQSANGCMSDTFSKIVSIEAIPEVSFISSAACIGQQIQFTNQTSSAFGTITGYIWDFDEGPSTTLVNPVHTYNQPGDFTTTLKAFTENGCTATFSKTFHVAPVSAFAGNDTTIAIGQPVQLRASGGQSYQWSPPDFLSAVDVFNPVAVLDKDQSYRVEVTTEEGCIGFDDIVIRVLKGPDIYVPTGFVPDGRNNIFRPILSGIQELYFFSVYNRWGQLVFTTREPGKGWDGRINGITQPTGTFVWMLKAKDFQGRVISKKGTVVLIR
ncbi:MAG TPA: PKD domain-containing protein [Chitinophagaceae bacterium]|nr:PKD domain-containing protein [Chitinophagaceae bacterium]